MPTQASPLSLSLPLLLSSFIETTFPSLFFPRLPKDPSFIPLLLSQLTRAPRSKSQHGCGQNQNCSAAIGSGVSIAPSTVASASANCNLVWGGIQFSRQQQFAPPSFHRTHIFTCRSKPSPNSFFKIKKHFQASRTINDVFLGCS